MNRQQNPLPGLRIAAIAFLATRTAEGRTLCSNPNRELVLESNCENPKGPGLYYMVASEIDLPVGTKIDEEVQLNDSFNPIDRANAMFPQDIEGLESGGFGKRQCDPGQGGGNGGGRPVVIVGGGAVIGG
ncbi:uncharacterized protein CTRU02_202663 [Colletotrichum truncatum]|uniref:Uncharacterized protein n=1 Tax=Colletotrichum truncatum TaxID=5467 RepID=A0ACC3ZL14_COLTU|nr:uncharacterized protein CTRU02_10588 [Colletotrichum truncatum]KAF6786889.1 hypothetical protein CTRU02_10588 [Colletotrichum truncatum]